MILDTHVFLWWLFDDPRLSERLRLSLSNPEQRVLVSSASVWEITTQLAGEWNHAHRDPFDRMLIAQARIEDMPLATDDGALKTFDIQTVS